MKPTDPTPAAAAATPAVLPLTQEEISTIKTAVRNTFVSVFSTHEEKNMAGMCRRLLSALDAAVAQRDAAETLAAFRLDTIHDLDGALAQLRPALSGALADRARLEARVQELERQVAVVRAGKVAAIGVANQENSVAVDLTLYVKRLKQAVEEADAKTTRWSDEEGEFVVAYGLPVGPWHRLLAVARDEPTPAVQPAAADEGE